MKSLLKFESGKLFHARVLYLCAAITVAVILMFAGIQKLTEVVVDSFVSESISESDMPEDPELPDEAEISAQLDSAAEDVFLIGGGNTGLSWTLTALVPYVIMVFGVFAAVYICGDFGNGTVKNIFSRGYSRSEVYFSKYLITLLTLLGLALFAMLVGFCCGTFMWRTGSGWSARVILLIFIQLLAIAAYNAFFNFTAALTKRMGPAMVISIAIPFAMPLILQLADLIIMSDTFSVSDYWISGGITAASSVTAEGSALGRSVLISVIYIALFTAGGWLLARKREV